MLRKLISFTSVVILALLISMTGCDNKDDTEALKKELSDTQGELNDLQRKYEAVCLDIRNIKASRRNLGTMLSDIDSSAKTTEEQLALAQQIIEQLQYEILSRDETIQQMQLIINDQETALQEFLDMLGQPTTDEVIY